MPWWDYIGWYNRRGIVLRIVLFPILFVACVVHGLIGLALLFGVVVPILLVKDWIEERRFWRKLREQQRVGEWSAVEAELGRRHGTLLVEISTKGPDCTWLIDSSRDEVDTDHIVPTWQAFEQHGWNVLDPAFESLSRWSVEQLGHYAATAIAVRANELQLADLAIEAKRDAVLVVPSNCAGCLSNRCR